LRINERRSQFTIAQADIRSSSAPADTFHEQTITFHLNKKTLVEPQVLGGNVQLWLDRVVLENMDQ
jgi:hypothetical protein